jgi:hypothetical protein
MCSIALHFYPNMPWKFFPRHLGKNFSKNEILGRRMKVFGNSEE